MKRRGTGRRGGGDRLSDRLGDSGCHAVGAGAVEVGTVGPHRGVGDAAGAQHGIEVEHSSVVLSRGLVHAVWIAVSRALSRRSGICGSVPTSWLSP